LVAKIVVCKVVNLDDQSTLAPIDISGVCECELDNLLAISVQIDILRAFDYFGLLFLLLVLLLILFLIFFGF
jgi:hypothetical protein